MIWKRSLEHGSDLKKTKGDSCKNDQLVILRYMVLVLTPHFYGLLFFCSPPPPNVCIGDDYDDSDNNNNDFISIALFHVRHAQLR